MRRITSPRALTAASRSPRRSLHLIDIENQLCGQVSPDACRAFYVVYAQLGLLGPRDHVVVGTSPATLVDTYPLPRAWRRVMGPEGDQSADIALLAAAPTPQRWSSYGQLVLATADGGLLDIAVQARTAGLDVTVVTHHQRPPHWRLYAAAHRHLAIRPVEALGLIA